MTLLRKINAATAFLLKREEIMLPTIIPDLEQTMDEEGEAGLIVDELSGALENANLKLGTTIITVDK